MILKAAGKRYLQKMHFRHPSSSEKVPYWGYVWHIEICKTKAGVCISGLRPLLGSSFSHSVLYRLHFGSSFNFSLSFWRHFLKKRSLSLEVTSHKYVELSTFAGYVLNMSWWYRPPAVAHFELHVFFPNLQPCAEIQIENCRAAVCPPQRAFNKSSAWHVGRVLVLLHRWCLG